jgi:ketosteroid isomerase-like protein
VDVARRALDASNRRDIDGFSEVATADFEYVPALLAAFEGGSIRGRDGLQAWWDAMTDTWDEFRVLAEHFRDLGDQVLVLGRAEARGRGGVDVDAPMGLVLDFRANRISRARAFLDHAEALEAVGLEE